MFTYVKLKNFMSFGDVEFNFKQTAKNTNQFVAIYGENGSGKSNFVKSIDFLYQAMNSFANIKEAEEFLRATDDNKNVLVPSDVIASILRENSLGSLMASCRTIASDEPTEIEYGFTLDGHEGFYKITFSEKITSESLYYFTGKQRGYIFDITSDEKENIHHKFWSGLFSDTKAEVEISDELQKFWGKHTFLGMIVQQINERNDRYIRSTLSAYLLAVIHMFLDMTIVSKTGNRFSKGIICEKPCNVLQDLEEGEISESQMPMLERTQRILRDFFTQTYADIKDVVYEIKESTADKIRYQLYVDKMIAGKVRHISFKNESSGTQQVLKIVRTLLSLFCGVTVVYDEIDDGIHDILLCNIIRSLQGEMDGQLIITTHNTLLLEEIDPKSAYVICVDYLGNKEVKCMADFAIQSGNNVRIRYLKGLFGGIPYNDGVDYLTIENEIEGLGEES